jgi:superfamily I DNA/RNA helicase
VALTFTNKAAGEMRESRRFFADARPKAHGARAVGRSRITTFHSFGLGVLTREKAAAGGAFTIFDQGDSLGA